METSGSLRKTRSFGLVVHGVVQCRGEGVAGQQVRLTLFLALGEERVHHGQAVFAPMGELGLAGELPFAYSSLLGIEDPDQLQGLGDRLGFIFLRFGEGAPTVRPKMLRT